MALVDTPTLPNAAPPVDRRDSLSSRLQLRLVISLPVLLVLFTACYGLISYMSFNDHWDELQRLGAEDVAGRLLQAHLVAMLALAVVAMVSGMGLAWAILRPINSLIEATRQVARGRLDRHAPAVQAAPELAALWRSFNEMIDRLDATLAERNRGLIDGIPIGILTTDLAGRVTAVSPVAGDMGLPPQRLIGRPVRELEALAPPAARPLIVEIARALDPAGTRQAGPLPLADNPQATGPALSVAWLRDADGQASGAVFTMREPQTVRELSDHLSHTDRLASLGTFTLGLAHELRNPLGAVKGLGQLLSLERDLPPRAAEYLSRMAVEIDRVDQFVSQLLRLSERPTGAPVPTRLDEALLDAAAAVREELGPERAGRVRLEEQLTPSPALWLERERVAGALAQILKNAYHFTPDGGTISLRSLPPGPDEAAALAVHNSGSAIAPHLLERIFDPFFTTGEHATGLGLTFAREIVAQNGGSLRAEVDADGVAFVVRFGKDREAAPCSQ